MMSLQQWKGNSLRYLHDYKFNSLFFKNFLSILLVVVIPVISLTAVIFIMNNNNVRQALILDNWNNLTRIASEMDTIWISQETVCLKAAFNSYVQNLAGPREIGLNEENLKNIRNIQNFISTIMTSNTLVDYVLFYFSKPQYYVTLSSAWSFYDKEYDAYCHVPVSLIYQHYNYDVTSLVSAYDRGIVFYRNIFKNKNLRGAVLVRIKYENIQRWLSAKLDQTGSRLLIIDDRNKVLVDTANSERGYYIKERFTEFESILEPAQKRDIVKLNDCMYVVAVQPSDTLVYRYVLLKPIIFYQKDIENTRFLMLVLFIAGILTSLILAWLLSLKVYRPIQIILNLLENPNPRIIERYEPDYSRFDELGLIATLIQQSHFQHLMIQDELKRRQDMLEEAQTVALQAQINPHFIYNTLETINWKIISHFGGENEISSMINDFSHLMRLTIQSVDDLVPIRKEIEHARLYLRLQAARFRHKFTVNWETDEKLLDYLIPCLILQPIVENAVTHGVKKLQREGVITILCREERDKLIIEVRDNGLGIDKKTLQDIRDRLSNWTLTQPEHIGLGNVHQRVQLIFGPKWGISIESELNQGTNVIVSLPKVR
jgi:two-component system sensor histidine kinase YesM